MDNFNSSYSCCLSVCEEIMKHFEVNMSDDMKKMCVGLGSGLGIGGVCGALLGSLMAAGFLCGDNYEKARLLILNDFGSRFKSLNCSGLNSFRDSDGGCEVIMKEAIETAEKYISLFIMAPFE